VPDANPPGASDAAPSAANASRLIREGQLSSEELVRDCLARIRSREPEVEAWAFLDEEHALAQARAADASRREGQPVGALHGIPVGIKDVIDTADYPTENGTRLHKGRTPREDAWVVSRLRGAGAVILGKTVTTEFAYYHPGKTRNPIDASHTPGGSSSGSAAAVAAGMVPLALGTQTNGSVIRPASFCGVFGFKPTHGLVPRSGILALSRTLDHVGVFARSLEDIALLAEELVGHDAGDPDTRPRARIPFREVAAEEPPLAPKLAFVRTPYWERVAKDAKAAFAELVEALGPDIQELELSPMATGAWDAHRIIMEAEMAANLDSEWRAKAKLSAELRGLMERGRKTTALDYQRALAAIPALQASFEELFTQRVDAIVTPAAPGAAPKGLGSTGDPAFCTLWTLLGLPALSLPLATDAKGMPIGVQLVGRRGYDARLLRTARWLVARVAAG
jgi:Asp-tRNA(Asn)/Glu-tRNA(Gln) amidotransferase A subunit family amidase